MGIHLRQLKSHRLHGNPNPKRMFILFCFPFIINYHFCCCRKSVTAKDDDNESVADSISTKFRRNEAERIEYFQNQPECGKMEPHHVQCLRCGKSVNLGRKQTYTVRPWEIHRARCDQKQAQTTGYIFFNKMVIYPELMAGVIEHLLRKELQLIRLPLLHHPSWKIMLLGVKPRPKERPIWNLINRPNLWRKVVFAAGNVRPGLFFLKSKHFRLGNGSSTS